MFFCTSHGFECSCASHLQVTELETQQVYVHFFFKYRIQLRFFLLQVYILKNRAKPEAALQPHFAIISLRRRQTQTIWNRASTHKEAYLKGHLNHMISSKVTGILLNRWILPVGVASGRVCAPACLITRRLALLVRDAPNAPNQKVFFCTFSQKFW